MLAKIEEKKLAIKLRRKGFSYSEILDRVKVSQSSLSLWLRDVKLTHKQKLELKAKKREGQILGAEIRKKEKLRRIKKIRDEARKDIKKVDIEQLFLIGISLYWAEGTKQSPRSKTERVRLANSDPRMIKMFLIWLNKCLRVKISPEAIKVTLYLHRGAPEKKIKVYWKNFLGLSDGFFGKTVFKKIKFDPDKKKNYRGVARLSVKKSTDLNRKIEAWTNVLCNQVLRGGVTVARPPLKWKI